MASRPYTVHLISTEGETHKRRLYVHADGEPEVRDIVQEYYVEPMLGEAWSVVEIVPEAPDVV